MLLLMLAQKNVGRMDAIELEPGCFSQLQSNLDASPWKERLNAIQGDVRQFINDEKYDFIIVNPPFYEHDLASPSKEKNLAKHSLELSLEELIAAIDHLLSPNEPSACCSPIIARLFSNHWLRKSNSILQGGCRFGKLRNIIISAAFFTFHGKL